MNNINLAILQLGQDSFIRLAATDSKFQCSFTYLFIENSQALGLTYYYCDSITCRPNSLSFSRTLWEKVSTMKNTEQFIQFLLTQLPPQAKRDGAGDDLFKEIWRLCRAINGCSLFQDRVFYSPQGHIEL
ncbi:hypothetical protein S83_063016, partial [Arachis hypogaea]